MKKLLFVLMLISQILGAEEIPPFEVKDPAVTENFRNIYYTVDQLPYNFIQNSSVNQSSSTFNVSSGTVKGQFRVYSDSGDSHFIVDSLSNNAVAYQTFKNIGSGTLGGEIGLENNLGGGSGRYGVDANSFVLFTFSTHPITMGTNGITGWKLTKDQEVLQPLQPSFLVTDGTGASDVTGDDTTYTELWPTEVYDQGSDFASNTFTAPVDGKYILTASVRLANIAVTHTGVRVLRIVTSNRTLAIADQETLAATYWNRCLSAVFDMDAGDTAIVTLSVGTTGKTVDVVGSAATNFFSGSLLN